MSDIYTERRARQDVQKIYAETGGNLQETLQRTSNNFSAAYNKEQACRAKHEILDSLPFSLGHKIPIVGDVVGCANEIKNREDAHLAFQMTKKLDNAPDLEKLQTAAKEIDLELTKGTLVAKGFIKEAGDNVSAKNEELWGKVCEDKLNLDTRQQNEGKRVFCK